MYNITKDNKKIFFSSRRIMKKTLITFLVVCFALVCLLPIFTACNKDGKTEKSWLDEKYPWYNGPTDWINDEFETMNMDAEEFTDFIGGFACGVCHPNENYEQIADANIKWMRFDISHLPLDKDGNYTQGYLNFKARAKGYADRGFKVMAVTPYPEDYIAVGLDPRDESNWPEIMKIARFYAEDLQGIVAAFQVTNEMGVPRFTEPMTISQAADFIGIQLKAMYRYRGNIAIGYNLGSVEGYVQLPQLMEKYYDYFDYVGIDFYLGCFDTATGTLGTGLGVTFTELAGQAGKPVMINEFGYIGYGEPKTDAEKLEILKGYGAQGDTLSEAEQYTKNNIVDIIYNENFPVDLRQDLELVCGIIDQYNNYIGMAPTELRKKYKALAERMFDLEYTSHLYRQLGEGYKAKGYDHTPEGQAAFMTDMIDDLLTLDYVCGTIVYCYCDSATCYVCGQEGCPVETGWGLVDGEGNPKPLYYAIQKKFGELQGK